MLLNSIFVLSKQKNVGVNLVQIEFTCFLLSKLLELLGLFLCIVIHSIFCQKWQFFLISHPPPFLEEIQKCFFLCKKVSQNKWIALDQGNKGL